MHLQHRVTLVLLASLVLVAVSPTNVSASFFTGFEPPTYVTGSLLNQDEWTGGPNVPRVQTAGEIADELAGAGLNPDNPIRSGEHALLMTYTIGESTGGFLRRPFTGLEDETRVVMDVWARPLTPGAAGSTIGFNQGNTFVGLMDNNEVRAAAFRFGVVRDGEGNIISTTIDYASAVAGPAVWVPSGLTWEADTWYNFRFDLDYSTKLYDFYVNDTKINAAPIEFYTTTSAYAARVFISRGTNQAGQIIDDISVVAATASLPGDFNSDGKVDAADYVWWRKFDSGNQAGYQEWRTHFGTGGFAADSVASGVTAIPEPSALVLFVLGCVCLAGRRIRIG